MTYIYIYIDIPVYENTYTLINLHVYIPFYLHVFLPMYLNLYPDPYLYPNFYLYLSAVAGAGALDATLAPRGRSPGAVPASWLAKEPGTSFAHLCTQVYL